MLKYALLGFLTYRNSSGYDLKQLMDVSTSNFWHAKQSQIYTTLKKLEKNGLVTSHVEPQDGRPDRRIYEITDAGREDLDLWLVQPIMNLELRKEKLLLKLFFSANLDTEKVLTQLRLHKSLHEANLTKYQTQTKEVIALFSASDDMARNGKYWESTRRFGEMYEEMYLRWVNETIEKLEE